MATPLNAPPKPTRDPDVHLKGQGKRKPPRTLKGDIQSLAKKASSVRAKWSDGREVAQKKKEVRKEAEEVLAPVRKKVAEEKALAGETVKPVAKVVATMGKVLDPSQGKTRPYVTSFGISCVLAWAVSPQILVAAYERIRFGTGTTSWGILHGPGRWFRDTVRMAAETGQMVGLIAAICVGLAPMFLFTVRNAVSSYLANAPYKGKMGALAIRWLARAPYVIPVVYLVGVPYPGLVTPVFGSPWRLEWWHFYVAGLFCLAYYCTMWVLDRIERFNRERLVMSDEQRAEARKMGPGLFHAVLMIPLASIISGALLHTPGAAW